MLGAGADHGRDAHDRVLSGRVLSRHALSGSRTTRDSDTARGSDRPRRSRAARFAVAAATVLAGTIASAGHGGTAYAMSRSGGVSVSPTNAPLSQLTTFTVTTGASADSVTDIIGVEFTGSGNPTTVGQLSAQSDGDLGGTFPATGAICGTNTVTLVNDSEAGNPVITQLPITAYCPSIQITPTTVGYGSEPATVRLTGSGFVDSSPVQILIDGHPVGQGTSDATGAVTMPVTVSGLGCTPAPHEVTAQMPPAGAAATVANSATAPLTVTGCPASVSTAKPAPPATLTANPDVVEDGQVTHVTGTGFTPNAPVALSWKPTSGAAAQSGPTVTADASGDIDDYLVVMSNDLYVPCDLVATQGTTNASASVLVQGGSMEPSTNDQLVFRQ